ncbi:hypothetical protein SAMN04244573_04002 [Azotobacter beijerinckii]|uniref:Uncharacterized protein n=1 Tax=Azotobacter beijerinckii TaxID=170623 RepID=A0A1H9QRW1_9GAMM|nr:hypothetical protein SAMN04244573_04002 [Azotobacter beijerinckii]
MLRDRPALWLYRDLSPKPSAASGAGLHRQARAIRPNHRLRPAASAEPPRTCSAYGSTASPDAGHPRHPVGRCRLSGSGVIPHPSDCRRRRAGAMPAWPNAADGPQAMAREEHGQTAGGHRRGLPPCAYRSATPRRNQRVAASATARPLTGSVVWTARGRGREGGTWEPAPVGVAPGGGPDFGERLARLTSSVKATIRARKTRALLNMRCIRLSLRPQPDSALASGKPYCAANVEKFWRLPAAPCRRAGGAALILMKASRRPVLP